MPKYGHPRTPLCVANINPITTGVYDSINAEVHFGILGRFVLRTHVNLDLRTECGYIFHIPYVATSSIYPMWLHLPCTLWATSSIYPMLLHLQYTLCGYIFHVPYVATSSIYPIWLHLHIPYVATSSMYLMWLHLPCTLCGYIFHIPYVATSSIYPMVKIQ